VALAKTPTRTPQVGKRKSTGIGEDPEINSPGSPGKGLYLEKEEERLRESKVVVEEAPEEYTTRFYIRCS